MCTEPAAQMARLPPTTLLYGDRDFHYYIPTLPEALKAVKAMVKAATGHGSVALGFALRADHHLYVDNPSGFHQMAARALA